MACQPIGVQDVIRSQGHPVLTIMSSRQAFHASNRFGLGPRPDELRQIGADPRGWLHHQLSPGPGSQPRLSNVAPSQETLGDLLQKLHQIRSLKKAQKRGGNRQASLADMHRELNKSLTRAQLQQLGARMQVGIETEAPFRERLVHFWSNHFTVSMADGKRLSATSCTAYEAETARCRCSGRKPRAALKPTPWPSARACPWFCVALRRWAHGHRQDCRDPTAISWSGLSRSTTGMPFWAPG